MGNSEQNVHPISKTFVQERKVADKWQDCTIFSAFELFLWTKIAFVCSREIFGKLIPMRIDFVLINNCTSH